MKKHVASISVLHNAKLATILCFVISLPMACMLTLPMLFRGMLGPALATLVVYPLLFAAVGFVCMALGAFMYNWVAGKMGGFEYTTADLAE